MTKVDSPVDVRKGEELDIEKLGTYLRAQRPELDGEITVQQFPAGFSNLTYALTVGEQRLILRRPPFGTKAKSAHDMGREFRVLSAVQGAFKYAPRTILFCDDPAVMGCDFYLMERMDGIVLRRDYPEDFPITPALVRAQHEVLFDVLAELHAVDYAAVGLAELGRPAGYTERQVTGWSKRYRNAMTEDAADGELLMQWLAANMPPDAGRAALIHNDYKLDNVMFDAREPAQIIGVFDWEMATLGDPLMDLGCTLSYWIEPDDPDYLDVARMMPTQVEGSLSREEILSRYSEQTGLDTGDFDFYYIFGLFRLAVIVQQIYYRYYHGQTQDQRFAVLIDHGAALIRAASECISRRN